MPFGSVSVILQNDLLVHLEVMVMHWSIHRFSDFPPVAVRNLSFWIVLPVVAFLGTYFAVIADSSVVSMVRQTAFGQVSIVCLISAQLLPFLIAAYAAYTSNRIMLMTVCTYKMFLFAFLGCLVWRAFGSAGWLLRSLFLFSDICLFPVLLWFSLRRLYGYGVFGRDLWICCCIVAVILLCDRFFVSPLLGKLT